MTTKKIKILFRLRSLEMGGVPRVVLDLLKNLPKDRFDCTLMLNLNQGELRTEIPRDIHLITLAKGKEDLSSNAILRNIQLVLRRMKLELYSRFPSLLYMRKAKEDFDLEVAPGYAEFEMVLNSPNKKSRKIGWFHTDVSYDKDQNRVMKRIELMKKFDWMIFGSAQTRQVIDDLYGVNYPKSSVIYNVIKLDEVRKKAQEFQVKFDIKPTFISIGRLHSRKGYHTLMNVHKRLLDEGLNHGVAIIGGGSEMENLQQQARQLNVESSFQLLDTKKNPWPYVKAADFFVLPSQSESYPLTIGEVMGLHKPIISTNVGGIPEMIEDGVDGILVNYDEDEIYEAMKRFLTDDELVRTLRAGTEQADQKFDNVAIYKQITDIFTAQYQLKNED